MYVLDDADSHCPVPVSEALLVRPIGADGSGLRRLTRSPSDDYACSFSPDGREILFTSNRTGSDQVFVMRADGSHPRNLSRTVTDDEATQWHS